jgi:predicted Rossmann fold nucleotide-binding protein DprA/Smf involved in DNA uptake
MPDDARVLLLLCAHLPGRDPGAPTSLSLAEWRQVATALRGAGLARPGELLHVPEAFWPRTGLSRDEVERLRALLGRQAAWDGEVERLEDRGIRPVTRPDADYPRRLRSRLRGLAPPVLFGAGAWELLERDGLAIVGSRGVDEEGASFTAAVADRCAAEGLVVVTGGAKGVDQIATRAALEGGGAVISVMAGDLERAAAGTDAHRAMAEGRLLVCSPYHPRTGFSVAHAMARNKMVYALAEWGLVVASAFGQGGTWAGAREVLRHDWVPLFVRNGASVPDGNRELLRPAARPFPPVESLREGELGAWLARQVVSSNNLDCSEPVQDQDLFALVWPRLLPFLSCPKTAVEVAVAFHLDPVQAQMWLQRADKEGRARAVNGTPIRYVAKVRLPASLPRVSERRSRYDAARPFSGSDDGLGWPESEDEEQGALSCVC